MDNVHGIGGIVRYAEALVHNGAVLGFVCCVVV